MLDLKGIDYELVNVLPGNQRVHMRLAGFREGTVPGLKIDGRKIQGSTNIARELAVPARPRRPAPRRRRRALG
jgi:glutathione S-transferase